MKTATMKKPLKTPDARDNGSADEEPIVESTKKIQKTTQITITAPNFERMAIHIRGTSPYVQHKFPEKAKREIEEKHRRGSTAGKAKKQPRNFEAEYAGAQYLSNEKWNGMPASAFRCAAISACRIAGFQMTKAKLSVFADADGFDHEDGTPLIKFMKGKPRMVMHNVRNATGVVDLRARPMWDAGWEVMLRMKFDADQFNATDMLNLIHRVGLQVGIGEGRPDSKSSAGVGWGTFEIVSAEEN